MTFSHLMNASLLIYGAFLLQAAGFLTRDELWLRTLVLAGSVLYVVYYYFYPQQPLWDAIAASLLLAAINIVLIFVIIRERTLLAMSGPETMLFNHFDKFTPGQFRRLMKKAVWQSRESETVLTIQAEIPEYLHYVVDGSLTIEKDGSTFTREGNTFIGEIGFLYNSPASATVTIPKGTTHVSWRAQDLRKLLKRYPAMDNAMIATLSFDLARKVATSTPFEPTS